MFYKIYLEKDLKKGQSIDEMIDIFENMCKHRTSVVDDFLLIESGNFNFDGKTEFYLSLVRQYRENVFADNFTMMRLNIVFPEQNINIKNRRKLKIHFYSDQCSGSFSKFFERLRKSALLKYLKENDIKILRYEIEEEEL